MPRFLVAAFLSLFHFTAKVALCDGTCDPASISGRELSGAIESRRNDTDGWVTTFWAEKEVKGNEADVNELLMSVNHRYFVCKRKTTIKIQGVITETFSKPKPDFLRFNERCGTNARITNNGKSLEKINTSEVLNGVAFTNRPLKDDELFEVMVDVRGNPANYAIGIGVTTHVPDLLKIPAHMNHLKSGNWLMYHGNVYKDGPVLKEYFMKDLKELKVGETVGVKRTSSGDLHVFINGKDQGVAAKNVPSPVYGVFELYYEIMKATIVDH